MASASLRSSLRTAVAVGSFGALAVFGTVATANAQDIVEPSSFGSLGSITGLIPDANWTNFNGFFGGSVGTDGSIANMLGSTGESVGQLGSQQEALETATGSNSGSTASIGQIAGNINPDAIADTNTGSATGSADLGGSLGAVSGQSVTGLLQTGSAGLGELTAPPVEESVEPLP